MFESAGDKAAGDKAAICRATNRSEIAARFAVAVKSPFDRSSCRAIKSLCKRALRNDDGYDYDNATKQ